MNRAILILFFVVIGLTAFVFSNMRGTFLTLL
ncbi:hypothetical protein JOC86_000835 [Bacillus pakistanensis]|uniref:NADH dehydrogenase subunit 6 n=1 Tax=Rossellomorea pakistanensis TaxID=992288 RepID=A0ABS2N8W8_9BACI|nr:hypothetical protein [Bacillus pakistanensis]